MSQSEEKELLDYNKLRISSPKIAKSRLAPLELSNERKKNNVSSPATKNKESDVNKSKSETIKFERQQQHDLALSSELAASTSRSTTSTNDEEKLNQNWKNTIEPVLNQMDICFKEFLVEKFCDQTDLLNGLLEQHQMLSKTCSKRATILKLIFKYLDTDCDRIKIKISRIIF